MQHLRIVGVNDEENMAQLILSDESGREFALPMDEALRHAATRPPVRPSQSGHATSPLTPREIQARLRAGATVDQVVAASGLTTAHVDRYAGPVHAERAYIAQRARATQVAPASSAEAHRAAFGDDPATLDAMVKARLRAMDVDLTSLAWDSWRREDGLWQITCVFDVDSSSTHGAGIGLRPPAEWTFQPETSHLRPVNRWAESLSTLGAPAPTASHGSGETQASASGARRRLSAVDSVFDVENAADRRGVAAPAPSTPASGASASGAPSEAAGHGSSEASPRSARSSAPGSGSPTRPEAGPRGEGREHEDLLDVLRARRGQRLGADAEADDRLALMLNRQDPQDRDSSAETAATPTSGTSGSAGASGSSGAGDQDDDEHSTVPLPRLRPVKNRSTAHGDAPGGEDAPAARGSGGAGGSDTGDSATGEASPGANDGRLDAWGFAYEGESEERGATAEVPAASADAAEPSEPEAAAEKPRKRAPARRASMPKWDDILFGSKND